MSDVQLVQTELVASVAATLKGNDSLVVYLQKQTRAINDILAGRTVKPWRLERLQTFFEAIAHEALRRTASPGCTTNQIPCL